MRRQIVLGIVLFASLLVGTACGQSLNDQLFIAVKAGDKTTAEALIAKGADVNAKDNNGETPLFRVSNKDVAELLIAKGADVNAKGKSGYTPLFTVSNKEVMELLIAKGAKVNTTDRDGDTPLHSAARNGQEDSAVLLIANGADVNALNNSRRTPIEMVDIYGPSDPKIRQEMKAILLNPSKSIEKRTGSSPGDFQNLLTEFRGQSSNDTLRTSIINISLQQHPAIPPEAEAAAGRATYIFKNAKSPDEVLNAAKEYLAAIEAAPWVANYYFNLCTVLEKTPYSQQALHACKLYLVAAPDATDAGAVRQRVAGLQYAYDRDKAQMQQRTRYIKVPGVGDQYRFGGITNKVSDKDIVLKLVVDWGAAPPKYQVYAGCIGGDEIYGVEHDLVSTDNWISFCNPEVNMHLVIKPEGEGFVEVSDASGGSLRATLNELFEAKQKTMAQAIMFSANSNGERFYVTYEQGGVDLKHAGYAMYESDCNGSILKKDPRALPDDFISAETRKAGGFGRFTPEVNTFLMQPNVDVCTQQFASKTGYHFGEAE